MGNKAECLDEIEVILTLIHEYESRLSTLAKQYSEKKLELEAYATTEKIIAANEPNVEQHNANETVLTGKV